MKCRSPDWPRLDFYAVRGQLWDFLKDTQELKSFLDDLIEVGNAEIWKLDRRERRDALGELQGAGFAVQEIQIQQHHPGELPPPGSQQEAGSWALHPSRVDVHGMANCPSCRRPSPVGELQRWGHCSFCQRERMGDGVAMGTPSEPQ